MKNLKTQLRLASLPTLILLVGTSAYGQQTPSDSGSKHFIEVDAPGAGPGPFQGTAANDINAKRQIVGVYFDDNNVGHVFLREADGKITSFEAPGAGTGSGQ